MAAQKSLRAAFFIVIARHDSAGAISARLVIMELGFWDLEFSQ